MKILGPPLLCGIGFVDSWTLHSKFVDPIPFDNAFAAEFTFHKPSDKKIVIIKIMLMLCSLRNSVSLTFYNISLFLFENVYALICM